MTARLLITDPLHPALDTTIASLHAESAATTAPPWTLLGLIEGVAPDAPPAPLPGLTELLTAPPHHHPDWVPHVTTLAVAHRVDAILPWTNQHTELLASAATDLAELGTALVCPPAHLVDLAADRCATADRLAHLGIATPATIRIDRSSDLGAVAPQLGYPHRQLLLRPRTTSDTRGTWIARPDTALTAAAPPPALPLYALMTAATAGDEPLDLVLQERLPGVDVTVDLLAHDGTVLGAIARTCTRTSSSACVEGTIGPLWPGLDTTIERLVAGLRWTQLLTVRLVWDPHAHRGTVYDLTARASHAISTAGRAGIPLLSAAVRLALTGRPPALPAPLARPVRYRRSWTEQVWPA